MLMVKLNFFMLLKKKEDAEWYAYTMNNDTDVEAEQCQYFIVELDLISFLEVKNGKTSNR